MQCYFHFVGTLHNVIICNNVTVSIDDYTRTGALAWSALLWVRSEKVLQRIIGFFEHPHVRRNGTDVNDRLRYFFGGGCKIQGNGLAVFV